MPDEPCLWTYDDIDGLWETSCGRGFCFSDGGPKDNAFLFCPYCGNQLEPLEDEDLDEDEDEETDDA